VASCCEFGDERLGSCAMELGSYILRDISLTCSKQKSEIFNIPSLGILIRFEGERAYSTLFRHGSECVKSCSFIYSVTHQIEAHDRHNDKQWYWENHQEVVL
jgi:hypothetical protein